MRVEVQKKGVARAVAVDIDFYSHSPYIFLRIVSVTDIYQHQDVERQIKNHITYAGHNFISPNFLLLLDKLFFFFFFQSHCSNIDCGMFANHERLIWVFIVNSIFYQTNLLQKFPFAQKKKTRHPGLKKICVNKIKIINLNNSQSF